MKYISYIIIFLINNFFLTAQSTFVADIEQSSFGHFGRVHVMSSDGNVIAATANISGTMTTGAALVKVFHQLDGEWQQFGSDLSDGGENYGFGRSLALSSNGQYLAIGSNSKVRNYQMINGEWHEYGSIITDGFEFGASLDLSADGSVLIVGNPRKSEYGMWSGKVSVFHFVDGEWVQLGNTLYGEEHVDMFGNAVSISSDGTRIAVAAVGNDGHSNRTGKLFAYELFGETWIQLGSTLRGNNANSSLGSTVALSEDGTVMAAYAAGFDNAGRTYIYKYNGNEWSSFGNFIEDENFTYRSRSISLSRDGQIIFIGKPISSNIGAEVYQFDNGTWYKLDEFDSSIGSVSISGDATSISFCSASDKSVKLLQIDLDTDGDGLTDYYEIKILNSDPLNFDSPLNTDSDGDGLVDSEEILGSRYEIVNSLSSWHDARDLSYQSGGHLAVVTSQLEWEVILNKISETDTVMYWLGATDENTEGFWEWVTGEDWLFTKWHSGEPNNEVAYNKPNGENYLGTWSSNAHNWNDADVADPSSGYIIEYHFGQTDPSIPDTDSDGLNDGEEALNHLTNPNLADTDGDGLLDNSELFTYFTNPLSDDTDGDGFSDGLEVGLDPNSDSSDLDLSDYGFMTSQEIQDLRPGSTLIEVTGNQATVQLQMEESSDLETWEDAGTPATMTIPADTDTKFFRFKMAE